MNDEKNDIPDIVKKKIQIEALVPLDGATLVLRNLAHAEADAKLRKMKAEEKERAQGARKAIAEIDKLVAKLGETVLEGSEMGMVDAEETWNYRTFQVDTIRCDTSEVVSSRPMSAEERREWKEPPLEIDLGESTAPAPDANGQKLVLKKGRGRGAKADAN